MVSKISDQAKGKMKTIIKKKINKEIKEFKKGHDLLIDAIVFLNNLNSTFASNLSKETYFNAYLYR